MRAWPDAGVTAITERDPGSNLSWTVPRAAVGKSILPPFERNRERSMSLGMMAGLGLGAALVLIVVAITLINKFAN